MILDELKVIEPPDDQWLTRLRKGHWVWLVKEQKFGKIEELDLVILGTYRKTEEV